MKKRRIYVLSIDAMISEDIPFMRTLPNLGPVLENASIVSDVVTVYPSLTYTVHASMLTGVYPNRHHIINNEIVLPFFILFLPFYKLCAQKQGDKAAHTGKNGCQTGNFRVS